MAPVAEKAARILKTDGITAEVINARYVKPLDTARLTELCTRCATLVTVEEGVLAGGFGEHVAAFCHTLPQPPERVLNLTLPECFVTHGPRAKLLADVGLTPEGIVAAVRKSREPQSAAREAVGRLAPHRPDIT
jgi:1-deoxy-D-xylulose-5-phosphate synthase